MPPKLTVGIPVYNRTTVFLRCLDSVLGQTLAKSFYEVVVADDGSTHPETIRILKEKQEEYHHMEGFFRVIRLPQNSGGASAPRNAVIDAVAGEYLFFVDSDDWLGDEALQRIYDFLVSNERDYLVVNQTGRRNIVRIREDLLDVPVFRILSSLTPGKVFKTAEIRRLGLYFDIGLVVHEDFLFVFSFIIGTSSWALLGGYDYYHVTGQCEQSATGEAINLTRLKIAPALNVKNKIFVLSAMLKVLYLSDRERKQKHEIAAGIVIPRVLVRMQVLEGIFALNTETERKAVFSLLSAAICERLPEETEGLMSERLAEAVRCLRENDYETIAQLFLFAWPGQPEHYAASLLCLRECYQRSPEKIVLYGAGSNVEQQSALLSYYELNNDCYCDSDPGKHRMMIGDRPVISPAVLFKDYSDAYIVITNIDYAEEISTFLRQQGIRREKIFLSPALKLFI